MRDHDALPPIVPIDATLALRVLARRAVIAPRHLLASMPLLGHRMRRLTRGSATGSGAAAFKWRAQRGWHPAGGPMPSQVPVAALQSGATTSAPHTISVETTPPVATSAYESSRSDRTDATSTYESSRSDAPSGQVPPSVREPATGLETQRPSGPSAGARGLAVAPSLVWFARWREVRLMRVTGEQRSASPAGDMLHPLIRRRATPVESSSQGRARGTLGVPSSLPASSITRRIEWAPLASVLRTSLTSPRDNVASVDAQPRWPSTASTDVDAIAPARHGTEDGRAALVPLVPSVGVATRAAVHAATQASAHATARALQAVNDAVAKRVAAQVRHDVAQAVERMTSSRAQSVPEAPALVDERVVNVLLGRMRVLLREEQFRHGQIR